MPNADQGIAHPLQSSLDKSPFSLLLGTFFLLDEIFLHIEQLQFLK
jgi:hypothetical protein